MKMLDSLRHIIGLRSPLRLAYHWLRGFLAFALSGNPAKGMYVIGVTGTKGKTTTSTLIATALERSGKTVCLLSTAQVWMAGEKRENQSKMTMDSPFKLWKHIREAKKMGVTHLVLETSSHGIYYFRNFGIRYNIVTLTNISQDHLDLHGTMEHYVATKARLFAPEKGKICILPLDCEYLDIFLKAVNGKLGTVNRTESASASLPSTIYFQPIIFSMNQDADFRVTHIETKSDGMEIKIHERSTVNDQQSTITTKLVGMFNAENILTAYTTLRTMGIETAPIQEAWKNFTGVPGRMEPVPNSLGLTILVDYAHTEASLHSVLETLRFSMKNDGFGITQARMILVFGATGDRDTTKRPKMGAVAHELADIVVLTDDDTYTEPSGRIIEMVKGGIPRTEGDTFQILPDRKEAIYWALRQAHSGDIILIAGKGCETVQLTNKGSIPWSDRGVVESYLEQNIKEKIV